MPAGPIVISILANASQANATLNQTATTAGKVGAGFQRMRLPAIAALGAVTAGAKTAIGAASDLQESVSKAGVIFGSQAGGIEAFAAKAAGALGQSKTQALEAASTFGQIGQKAGLSGAESAKFAKQFTTLSSDLASFNNTTPEEAITAIGAAMRGESEPIRRYGVSLDDATLRARALKLGLIDNVKTALTPQQKALAASREILAQTTKAQGDFARTSDGAANKSRILAARSEDLRAKLGTSLLPAYVKLQEAGLKALSWMSRNESTVKRVAVAIAALAAAVLVVNIAMKAATAVMAIFNAVATVVRVVITAARIAMFLFNLVLIANPIVLIVAAVALLIAGLVLFFTKTRLGQQIIATAWEAIKVAFEVAKNAIGKAITAVVGFVKKLVSVVVAAVVAYINAWRRIITFMIDFAIQVGKKIKNVIDVISEIPGKIEDGLKDAVEKVYNIGKDIMQGLIDGLKSKIGALGTTLAEITKFIADNKGPEAKDRVLLRPAGQTIMDGLIQGLIDRRRELARQLKAVTREIENGITPALGSVLTLGDARTAVLAPRSAATTTTINVTLDSRMTEAEMGVAYKRAINAAQRQGLIL